jgi:hypothetical protein
MAKHDLNAYLNHGRWIIHCPRCDTALPAKEEGMVCPICWPGVNAKALQPIPGGLFRPVADAELINQVKAKAKAKGELYAPVFPAEKEEIEKIVRMRPKVYHVNWTPGETVEQLRQQNIERGDPVPADAARGKE